jgi:hypothetical protein
MQYAVCSIGSGFWGGRRDGKDKKAREMLLQNNFGGTTIFIEH